MNTFFVVSGSLDTSHLLIVDLIMVSVSIKPLHQGENGDFPFLSKDALIMDVPLFPSNPNKICP
jgi:hypothetical protein